MRRRKKTIGLPICEENDCISGYLSKMESLEWIYLSVFYVLCFNNLFLMFFPLPTAKPWVKVYLLKFYSNRGKRSGVYLSAHNKRKPPYGGKTLKMLV